MNTAGTGSFQEAFEDRVATIKRRAAEAGMTMKDVCEQSNVSRATVERWKTETPLTIQIVDRMEDAVARKEQRTGSAE